VNITRGLVRVWIVLTGLYLANQFFSVQPQANHETSDWWSLMWIFGAPPVVLAIVLALLGWIVSGFRSDRPN